MHGHQNVKLFIRLCSVIYS